MRRAVLIKADIVSCARSKAIYKYATIDTATCCRVIRLRTVYIWSSGDGYVHCARTYRRTPVFRCIYTIVTCIYTGNIAYGRILLRADEAVRPVPVVGYAYTASAGLQVQCLSRTQGTVAGN